VPQRIKLILFAFLAIGAILLLSMSLTGLDFEPGKPLPFAWENFQPPQGSPDLPGGETVFNIFRAIYFIAWLLFPLLVLYIILSPQARKTFLKQLLRILPFILFLLMLGRIIQSLNLNNQLLSETGSGGGFPPAAYPLPGEEFIPSTPPWAVWTVSLILSLLIITVIGLILFFLWKKRTQKPDLRERIGMLGDEAQTALDAIESGVDLRNVVIRCYYEMSQIVSNTRGIQRGLDITPMEFEKRLEEKGFPREPLRQLTTLFEEVRYGSKEPGKLEEQRAVTSLTTIVDFCKVHAEEAFQNERGLS
jgi:hypothetical protein